MDPDEREGEEQAVVGLAFDGGKKGRIFIIDYGEHMFTEGQWRFRLALQALRDQLNKICCTGDMNQFGAVIFVNSSKSKTASEGHEYEYIFVHRDLGLLDADYVKWLDAVLGKEDLLKEFHPELGDSAVCDWSNVMNLCQNISLRHKTNKNNETRVSTLRKKVIHIFTTDNTDFFDINIMERAKNRVNNELRPKNVEIQVYLLEADWEGNEFTEFWKEIDPEFCRYTSIQGLQDGLHFKNYALRSTTSLPFILGEGFQFAVGLYYLVKPQLKPSAILMDSETSERVEQRVHFIPEDAEIEDKAPVASLDLLPGAVEGEVFEGEVGFARDVGGVSVMLDREQMEKLRRFDQPGITLIGFKPMRLLKESHRMSPAKFIHPLDNVIHGSSTVYRALLRKCLDRNLFILVRYTQKRNTPPQLCALVPQSAEGAEQNVSQYIYEGFHLLELPFAEEARNLRDRYSTPEGIGAWPSANQEQLKAAGDFISRLTQKFSPDQFMNPVLQRHYKAVETVALDLDMDVFDEQAEKLDTLQPYFKNQANADRVASQVARLKEVCWSKEEEGTKTTSRGRKKTKKEEEETDE